MYLPPPWGDCKATPIESDFFTNYSLTACRLDCETRYLAENCNCRMVHMPGERGRGSGRGSGPPAPHERRVPPQATPTSARRSSTRSARTPRWVRTGHHRCGGGGKEGGGTDPTPPSPGADFLVKKDSEYCACRTPCDTVRYGKELSMVKIPSKASARYLARKFNKTEQYIA